MLGNIFLKQKIKTCGLLEIIADKGHNECLDSLLPCITAVFNNSLVSGVFPSVYKSARVKPLLKKMSLDPDDLKNYRPVSNLSFLSKRKNSSVSAKRTLEPQQPSQSSPVSLQTQTQH